MYTRLSLVDLIRLLLGVSHCFVGVSGRDHGCVRVGVSLRSVARLIGAYVAPLDP